MSDEEGMIEFASTEDIPAMVGIENRCFDTDRLQVMQFAYILTVDGDVYAVLKHRTGDIINAIGVLQYRAGFARIYSLAVHPAWRRENIGKKMVARMEQLARIKDRSLMRIEVKCDNSDGEKFWKAMGYKQYGTECCFYEDGKDAILMEKAI